MVKIETDEGVFGWGESGLSGREKAVAGALEHYSQFLIGRDPFQIGAIWQGRFSIMFAMGGVAYAARAGVPTRSIGRGIVIAGACAEVLTLWQTLRRYMVGLDGSFTLQHASWRPPLNPWLLIAINAAAIAWLGVVALSSGDDVAEHVDEVVGRSGVVEDR